MKHFAICLLVATALSACATQPQNPFQSVSVGANYTDPSTGATYGGTVTGVFKPDSSKLVLPVK